MDTYVISDLHGYKQEFLAALDRLPANPGRLVFLGDYLDKGPDCLGLLEVLANLKHRFPETELVFLRGNHDWWYIRYLAGADVKLTPERKATLTNLGSDPSTRKVQPWIAEFFNSLLWSYTDEVGNKYVHAYYSAFLLSQGKPSKKSKLVYGPTLPGPEAEPGFPNRDEWYKRYRGQDGKIFFGHYNLGKLNGGWPTVFPHATCVDCCVQETGILRWVRVKDGEVF